VEYIDYETIYDRFAVFREDRRPGVPNFVANLIANAPNGRNLLFELNRELPRERRPTGANPAAGVPGSDWLGPAIRVFRATFCPCGLRPRSRGSSRLSSGEEHGGQNDSRGARGSSRESSRRSLGLLSLTAQSARRPRGGARPRGLLWFCLVCQEPAFLAFFWRRFSLSVMVGFFLSSFRTSRLLLMALELLVVSCYVLCPQSIADLGWRIQGERVGADKNPRGLFAMPYGLAVSVRPCAASENGVCFS